MKYKGPGDTTPPKPKPPVGYETREGYAEPKPPKGPLRRWLKRAVVAAVVAAVTAVVNHYLRG